MAGWNASTLAGPDAGSVTILEGASFCVSDTDGDIHPRLPHGLFVRDTRILSTWLTRINGHPVEPLAVESDLPYRAVLLGRLRTQDERASESSLVIERRRTVATGLTELLVLRNFSDRDIEVRVEMRFAADFADLFDVKASRRRAASRLRRRVADDVLLIEARNDGARMGVAIRAEHATVRGSRLISRARVPARGTWSRLLQIVPTVGGEIVMTAPDEHADVQQQQDLTTVEDHDDVADAVHQGQVDIGALRIVDPARPGRTVIAAGAPWYMALFGRDSILSSIMTLPVDPGIALSTFRSLGDRQGEHVDRGSEEEPGRILHEVRFGPEMTTLLAGGDTYFGSIDATPLYVVGVGELLRWGLPPEGDEHLPELMDRVDRCLAWIDEYGDRNGDGFVEYERSSTHGLINQGWKDSWDSIASADGTIATPPIALCEVQGYVYAAFLARARMARLVGDRALVRTWTERAARLKRDFNARFWLPERGYYALALDGEGRPVDARASNMGHCLWSGIVDHDKAALVARRLLAPDMFSGWGVRTLSSEMARYNPVSYHNGSVWPHDNALIAAGLMRYGFVREAQAVAMALFDAAGHFDGRLPELFCGFPRAEQARPVGYPNACSPQAWAAATPISLMRTLLRLEVDDHAKTIRIDPALPPQIGGARIENLLIGGARVEVRVARDAVEVRGLPPGFSLERARGRRAG